MNKKLMAVAGLLIAGFILAGSVSALGGKDVFQRFVNDDVRTQLDTAIANHDYEAFKQVQATTFPGAPELTQEQFDKIVARHDFQTNVDAAIASGNYSEWKTLMEQQADPHSTELLAKINADNFHYLNELKQAQDKIKQINDELGIQGFEHPPMMMGFGHKGMRDMKGTTAAEPTMITMP